MEQILRIGEFIMDSFIHLWPYLLITIPLAVVVKFSGASKLINQALRKKPLLAILLATLVGALSPFCSCGVIPVIASLLIGGVPLAPVMSFWIASPSMDPEIFLLSTASIGWELSVWRLVATFIISLSAGYITHFSVKKGLLGTMILKEKNAISPNKIFDFRIWKNIQNVRDGFHFHARPKKVSAQLQGIHKSSKNAALTCCVPTVALNFKPIAVASSNAASCTTCEQSGVAPRWNRKELVREIGSATTLVAKFMALAFFINALITFYVPADLISNLLGGEGNTSILIATLVGIPVYTSNLTALPLVGGLLILGMNKGAALAFLIAGPTTTLPAMAAVWGIVKPKVFVYYLSFSLMGALVFGFLYNIIS